MSLNPLSPHRNYLRTALFVDFDNVFLQLESEDEKVAARFAEQPDRWLRWLESYTNDGYLKGLHPSDTEGQPRRILLRRAYLNPRAFHRFRAPFIRFGFEVVDCPPLTTGGKTSTDIYMVMDIMDAIAHSTPFDEFILMSSDADFTPVIARLRKHDRFTLVVSLGQAAAAYRAACDHLVEQDEFIESGMGVVDEAATRHDAPPPSEVARGKRAVLHRIVDALAQVIDGTGPVPANQLPTIYKKFAEFTSGENWLGFGSLRGLTEAVVGVADTLALDDTEDPWQVRFASRGATPPPTTNGAGIPSRQEVGAYVQKVVRESDVPIDLARLSQLVTQKFGDALRDYSWQGAGSFKGYLSKLPLGSVAISSITPGLAYDPERHELPDLSDTPQRYEEEFEKQYPEIAELARKIHYVTDMPYLMPEVYAVMLKEIAEDVNEHGYHMVETSKSVRDSCNGKGIPVARAHVNFVLRGLTKAGHRFQETDEERAQDLGRILVQNTFHLCERAELNLDEEARELVRAWILSGLPGS